MVFCGASERREEDQAGYGLASVPRSDLADQGSSAAGTGLDLAAYRGAVGELVDEVRSRGGARDRLEKLVTVRLKDPDLGAVLDRLPGGADTVITTLLEEAQSFRPSASSSASDLPSLVRVHLLSQIDTLWWGDVPPYETDSDVAASPDLIDLGPLRSQGRLRFQYRSPSDSLAGRAVDFIASRVFPTRWPRPGHLRFTRTRPEAIAFLNQLAREVAEVTATGTPPLWVTSLVRSVHHQRRLQALGFAAVLPSAHCVGYGIDIELQWFRQFDEKGALQSLLLDHQDGAEVNVIDEGPAWHVCLSPDVCEELARTYRAHARRGPSNSPQERPSGRAR